jgi:hypothetical protein
VGSGAEGRAAAPERVAPYGEVSGQRRVDMKFGQTYSDALERAKNRQNDQHRRNPVPIGQTGYAEHHVDLQQRAREGPHRGLWS